MLTDIEIAQSCEMQPIGKIAEKLNIPEEMLEPYGRYKAKVDHIALKDLPQKGRLVLVTAINPTPAGEGKTTVSIGLADALRLEGYNACLALREPSLGPVFGVKGGAAGGGYAQVVPMEDINLHFTGDMHAITAANNLIAAMVDNSIQQGNPCRIDPRRVTWKRCMDMNDRQLRSVIDGLGGKPNGTPREDGFDITTASEIMATLCLASSIADLKARIARIVVARTYDDQPVTAGDIHAQGAAAALLKDALRPNLVQTLIGTPAFVHGGPFANIAHGCNTVIATQTALRLADVGLRRGSRRGKVYRYQVPHGEPRAQRGGAGGDGSRAQEPRRRGEGRAGRGEPRSAGARPVESAPPSAQHPRGLGAAPGRRAQPLYQRHRRGDRAGSPRGG